MTSINVHSLDHAHCIATYRNVLLFEVRGAVTFDALHRSHGVHEEVIRRYPGGLGVFVIGRANCPIPDQRTRETAALIIKATAGEVLCQSTTIEGSGFWAAAARSAVSAVNLLSRAPNPTRVFGDVDDAIAWQAPFLAPQGTTAEGLREAIGELHASLAEHWQPAPLAAH